jgi:hypothetical protein
VSKLPVDKAKRKNGVTVNKKSLPTKKVYFEFEHLAKREFSDWHCHVVDTWRTPKNYPSLD